MKIDDDIALDADVKLLWMQLIKLHKTLRGHTISKYNRLNPFAEDLFDWKEKGEYWGGKNVTVYDSSTISGNVTIGDNTWIGPFCSLDGGGSLSIGENCSISAGVQILTHDTIKWALSGEKADYEYSPVIIGDCCFIGTHAVITKGITIGKCCVIGAGAVVTKDVPDYSIVAGVPAKQIGKVIILPDGNIELNYD